MTGTRIGKKQRVEFYEWMLKTGRIKKGGAAHERLLFLKDETKSQRQERLRKFIAKRQKEKNNV